MDRTSAGLLLGWALVLASPALGLANLFVQWRSCRPDGQMEMAPADWAAEEPVHRPLGIGCDGSFVVADGSTVAVSGPFDWTFVLLAALAIGIALIVECIRVRREPAPSFLPEASSPRP